MGLNLRHFNLHGVKFTFWDIAGNKNFYKIWKNYIGEAHLIVFFVDGTEKSKAERTEDLSALKVITSDP